MKRVPMGCDQQGRYPEAAAASSEIGANQDDEMGVDAVGDRLLVISILIVAVMVTTLAFVWMVQS